MEISEIIKAYGGILPSRGELRRTALSGTEEQQATANMLLRLLPKVDPSKERWEDSGWGWNLTPEELSQSPEGQFILDNCVPKSVDESAVTVTQVESEPPATDVQVTNASPLQLPDDGVNDYLKQLDWPPKSAQTPQPKAEEEPRNSPWPRYTAGKPSAPSTDQQPMAPDDFDSNKPI